MNQKPETASGADRASMLESEVRFRTLFEQAPFSVQLLAADGRTIEVNKAWEALWGLDNMDVVKSYVLGGEYNILTDPQLKAKGIAPYIERAFKGEDVTIPPVLYDPRELGMPGRSRWVMASAHPIKDDAGRLREVMLVHEDVTERMESETALRKSEERFRSLVMATSQVVWISNSEGEIEDDSPSWRAFTGQSYDQFKGYGWADAIHPEDRERVKRVWAHCASSGDFYHAEMRIKAVDGNYRWVEARAVPIMNADGAIREWIGSVTDITEKKHSEGRVRASEERLSFALDAGCMAAWDWNLATGWSKYSAAAQSLFNLKDGPVENLLELVHPGDRNWLYPDIERAKKGELPFDFEFRILTSDGRALWLTGKARLRMDPADSQLHVVGVLQDITERKTSEERLRLATDAGNIGIWEWDMVRNRVHWSDKVYELHGLNPGGFGGRAEDFSALVHPEDRPMLWQEIEHALKESDSFSAEFRTLLPNGGTRWLATWARVHRSVGGAPTLIVGATIDIDAHIRAQEKLRDADRRKDEFLAMLAHELRNPLAPIKASADLMRLAVNDEERVKRVSEIISRQVNHMTSLVDDLLDVSRVTRGLVSLQKTLVDVRQVVSDAIEQVRPLIETKKHDLTEHTPQEAAFVLGDSKRLVQIVVNLLTNAAKFTPERGNIFLNLEIKQEQVFITVEDNGIGMAPGLAAQAFELFVQAERTPDRAQGGLGIGLALVKSLVEQHGGQVSAQSGGIGKGSRFIICLPLQQRIPKQEQLGRSDDIVTAPMQPLKVLIVDDNVDAAQTLAMLTQALGHRVIVEHSSRKALALVKTEMPDICLLDIGLPEMDGYELASRIRAELATSRITLVAVTGYGQEYNDSEGRGSSFDHHFLKPVDMARLSRVFSEIKRGMI